MKEMAKMSFPHLVLLAAFALTIQVHARDFISIDCGISDDSSSYTDLATGLTYVSDESYIDTGINVYISLDFYKFNLKGQFWNVKSFPQGMKNCYTYTITPQQVNFSGTYLIRASFMYGNYDGLDQLPEFDLHIGLDKWDSVSFSNSSSIVTKEIIYFLLSENIYICLVNTGSGTPFMSSLELRPLDGGDDYYNDVGPSALLLFKRLNFGPTTNEQVRFPNDTYDRIWEPFYAQSEKQLNVSRTSLDGLELNKQIPDAVQLTAIRPRNSDEPLELFWNLPAYTSEVAFYMYFTEFQVIPANESREFNIFVNGELLYETVTFLGPNYFTASGTLRLKDSLNISISKSENSTLPPFINAIEIYTVKELSRSLTYQGDVDVMMRIKSTYGVKRNWQGDPCYPQADLWAGINCSYNAASNSTRIISLDLSSSGLTGEISPYISYLTSLQYLDLQNNTLIGIVPNFLAQLPFLKDIKLSHNYFAPHIPDELFQKSKNGSLALSVDGYPNVSQLAVPSGRRKKKNNSNIIVSIGASVAALFVLFLLLAIAWRWSCKQRKQKARKTRVKGRLLESTNREFTYSEILTITNNLERVIGKGGFGTVYHGYINDTQVAVKMLSQSSAQGYKEFRAEMEFLTRVHHGNLTTLVGYCNEEEKMGLIYEYMANGNLKQNLSDKHPNVLRWKERLCIALDAAQGLEYLHSACRPPIIHRDVKSANILLNEKLQAKLSDFGLSKAFPIENTHVSTAVAGTPGYLDPEYHITYKLNKKSDVFSFGVVLLEIITSRPVISREEENAHIRHWVSSMLSTEGKLIDIVDTRLQGDFHINSLQKAVEIAMACVSSTSIQRPSMNQVVTELKQCLALEMACLNEGHVTQLEASNEMASINFDSEFSLQAR